MNKELYSALSDVALSLGTFILAMSIGKRRTAKTWMSLFLTLALASGLGAIFHGIQKFHTPEFWVLVSTTSMASAFLFLGAVFTVVKPNSKILGWLWPLLGLAGLLLGGILSSFPFWYISVVSGVCLLISLLILPKSPNKKTRNWIYIGVAVTVTGLILQKFVGNTIFHFTQLLANICFWFGAQYT